VRLIAWAWVAGPHRRSQSTRVQHLITTVYAEDINVIRSNGQRRSFVDRPYWRNSCWDTGPESTCAVMKLPQDYFPIVLRWRGVWWN
jgi:hypothetical protein